VEERAMIWTAKVSSKGQITLPKELRERLGLKPGERIILKVEDNRVTLEKLPDVLSLYGVFAVSEPQDWKKVREDTMNIVAAETAKEGLE